MTNISNCGHDENNRYAGGIAGDQTGGEWLIRPWYSRPWNCVLRAKNKKVRKAHAAKAKAAALNNNIGYDQRQRYTFGQRLMLAKDYDPSNIKEKCETDCSQGIIDITKAIGRQFDIEALKNVKATYTGDMRSSYRDTGEYEILTDPKYLITSDYLLEGDILLNDFHHVTTNLEDGAKVSDTTGEDYMFRVGDVKNGSEGNDVKLLQRLLKSNGCKGADGKNLKIDGNAGENTVAAIKKYQVKKGLDKDGWCGAATWKVILYR